MNGDMSYPTLQLVALDTDESARALAEFYRKLLGYVYRSGDEMPGPGEDDEKGRDWLVLHHPSGSPRIAFQQVINTRRSTWPDAAVPQQLHLDLTVPSMAEFASQHQRALDLGATVLYDRSDDENEPLRVYADPAGHPFCIYVPPG